MNMNRVGNTSHPDRALADKGRWIERLQQRTSPAPTKSARCDRERQDEGMWIERLQQRRFFPGDNDE
jgi:hypothetical protein